MLPLGPLVPPFRFGVVEDELFRGAYPKQRNLRFLKRLRLSTIVSLIPEPPRPHVVEFCALHAITLVHIRTDKAKDAIPLTFAKVTQVLQILVDATNHPLYIHCLDGAMVTGVILLCLRKLQMWLLSSAMIEFSRFMRDGVIGSEESEFVEKFQLEGFIGGSLSSSSAITLPGTASTGPGGMLTPNISFTGGIPLGATSSGSRTGSSHQQAFEVPSRIPKWLWGGSVSFRKHPSLKVKIPAQTASISNSSSLPPPAPPATSSLQLQTQQQPQQSSQQSSQSMSTFQSSQPLSNFPAQLNSSSSIINSQAHPTQSLPPTLLSQNLGSLMTHHSHIHTQYHPHVLLHRHTDSQIDDLASNPSSGPEQRRKNSTNIGFNVNINSNNGSNASGSNGGGVSVGSAATRDVSEDEEDEEDEEGMSMTLQALALEGLGRKD